MQPEIKSCQSCKNDFTIESEDFLFYEKIRVPPPTFCPECRTIRRMVWRNEHNFYKKEDCFSKKIIFSAYPPNSPIRVCKKDMWWSDTWDPMNFGKEYDFSRPFFEQFRELLSTVPFPAQLNSRSVESEYTTNVGDLKRCYMCFNGNFAEDCAYGIQFRGMKNCYDFSQSSTSDSCAYILNVTDSYATFFSFDSANCVDVYYSSDCRNCSNCVGCVGLRNKSYCVFNKQYTKDEYFKILKELNFGSYQTHLYIQEKAFSLYLTHPKKYVHTMKSQNSSGEYIFGSKNVKNSFMCYKTEDVRYSQDMRNVKDSYDTTVGLDAEGLLYENTCCGLGASNVHFSYEVHPNNIDISYSIFCSNSSNLFGCISLRNKEYCIFNKQYTKEEYFSLKEKIINHMNDMPYVDNQNTIYRYGEFFPAEFSPFAYNQTIAHEFFPLEKEQAISHGFLWQDTDSKDYHPTVNIEDIPDHIIDTPESYADEIFECSHKSLCNHNCTKAFKVINSEIAFYKKHTLPFPRECPSCRYADRIKNRNSLRLWDQRCMCKSGNHDHIDRCPNEFKTSYDPDRLEIIYCESCYQKEIV